MHVTALDLLYLLQEEESDAQMFRSLDSEKKFKLLVGLLRRNVINTTQEFMQALAAMAWTHADFLDAFEDLWNRKKIGWDELDVLDTHPKDFKGIGILSDRAILMRIDRDTLCKRIPQSHHDKFAPCQGYFD